MRLGFIAIFPNVAPVEIKMYFMEFTNDFLPSTPPASGSFNPS